MTKNRKSQSASIHFGAALKASLLCLLIAGAAVGYVWQKSQIYQLSQQIRQREIRLGQLQGENQILSGQLSASRSRVILGQSARSLGLVPAQPSQIWRLPEPLPAFPKDKNLTRQFAAGRTDGTVR